MPNKEPSQSRPPKASWGADPRHGRRYHDVHRRRGGHQARTRQAHRLGHPAGHHPPGKAHRRPQPAHSRFRSAGRNRRSGVRRLGYLSKTTATKPPSRPACWKCRCWRSCASRCRRSSPCRPFSTREYVKRINGPNVKPKALQDGSCRDADGRYPQLQGDAPARPGWR